MTTHTAYLVLWVDTRATVLTQEGSARVVRRAGIYSEGHPTSAGNGEWPVPLIVATSAISFEHAKQTLSERVQTPPYEWTWELLDKTMPSWRHE